MNVLTRLLNLPGLRSKLVLIFFTITFNIFNIFNIAFAIEPSLEVEWQGEAARDEFGFSVSADGDTVGVGAPWASVNGISSGTVYVYVRDDSGNWGEPITWIGEEAYDYFGWSVSIDADTIVIGAPYDGVSGSVFVYVRDETGNWSEQAKWTGEAPTDMFGWSVSISSDTTVIGAHSVNGNGIDSGAAYVYERDEGGNWGDPTKWLGESAYDGFGRSVSIDRDMAVIGAMAEDSNGVSSGAAYIYARDVYGWGEPVKWGGEYPGDYFGWSVSVHGDKVAIGAIGADTNGTDSGSAYIYTRDSQRGWISQVELTGEAAGDGFGNLVSVKGDTLVVGSSFADSNGTNSGSAYMFELDGCGTWRKQTTLSGEAAGDEFGNALAMSSDGNRLAVGAAFSGVNGVRSGLVRVYDSSMFNYFRMNAGLNDAWYNPQTDGQGFFVTIFPDICKATLGWFTYDTELPPPDAIANLGNPGHRWLTAIGPIDGDQSIMNIVLTSGGILDPATEIQRTDPPGSDGYLRLIFNDCNSGSVEYDIYAIGQQGVVPIQRVANDNIVICEALK